MRRDTLFPILSAAVLLAAAAALALWPDVTRGVAERSAPAVVQAGGEVTAMPDARPGETTFGRQRLATGVELAYAERGDVAGAPVILLHGYSDSWFSFSRVLPLLPASIHAFALSQRGHGDSERPASGYALRDLAADVLAFMDAKGLSRATIVGHSMGSLVAQQVVLLAPTRVERLVLVGAATEARQIIGIEELAGAVRAFGDSVPAAFVREFQESTVSRPVPAEFMDRVVAESGKLPPRVWQGLMDGMLATPASPALVGSRVPTLLLWGDRDAYFPRAEQDALQRVFPAARLRVFAGVGHSPHWEEPEEFARELAAFVVARE